MCVHVTAAGKLRTCCHVAYHTLMPSCLPAPDTAEPWSPLHPLAGAAGPGVCGPVGQGALVGGARPAAQGAGALPARPACRAGGARQGHCLREHVEPACNDRGAGDGRRLKACSWHAARCAKQAWARGLNMKSGSPATLPLWYYGDLCVPAGLKRQLRGVWYIHCIGDCIRSQTRVASTPSKLRTPACYSHACVIHDTGCITCCNAVEAVTPLQHHLCHHALHGSCWLQWSRA